MTARKQPPTNPLIHIVGWMIVGALVSFFSSILVAHFVGMLGYLSLLIFLPINFVIFNSVAMATLEPEVRATLQKLANTKKDN